VVGVEIWLGMLFWGWEVMGAALGCFIVAVIHSLESFIVLRYNGRAAKHVKFALTDNGCLSSADM